MSKKLPLVPHAVGVAFVFLVAGGPAVAEPLRDVTIPLCSSVDADFAAGRRIMSPNCSAPVADDRRGTLEISLTAARGEARIGDFVITDAYLYNHSFAPEVWSVDPGDNILITIENGLSGVAGLRTNLHTHGLIVSPNNAPGTPKTPIGDNIFVDIKGAGTDAPGHHTPGTGDVPVLRFDKSATAFIAVPDDHPKGLFWYHPHPHGISGPQVIGGMSGLITIGQASDYVTRPAGDGAVEEVLLMLKDTQITRQPGQTVWRIDSDYDPGNCDATAKKRPGVCQEDDNQAWLFPVNGQIYPTIEIAEGTGQLWRIGNIAANITYNLEVVIIGEDGTEEPLPFQVISTDGVSIGRGAADEPIMRERLLLMPSARLEVLVAHPGAKGAGARAVFRSAGFNTGETPDEGDTWPAIDLAEVVFADTLSGGSEQASGAEQAGFALVADGGGAIDLTPVPATAAADASCPRLTEGQTRIVAFDIPSFAEGKKPGVDFAVPPGCMADQEYDVIGSIVVALEDDSSFDAILAAYDKAVGDKYATALGGKPQAYRGKCFDGVLDTCVPYPAVQDWWVVNASNEAHNFHIHQTRFKVLAVRGTDSAFTPIPDVYEDNYPVLAGQAVKVRIPFTRPEQIGTFVYHCHILEHEDNGMMAAIEVRDVQ